MSALKRVVLDQRAEIARLKGLKGPPSIKPSGMEQASEAKPRTSVGKRRGRGAMRVRIAIEDRVLMVAVPVGSRFKGPSFKVWNYGRWRSGSGVSIGWLSKGTCSRDPIRRSVSPQGVFCPF